MNMKEQAFSKPRCEKCGAPTEVETMAGQCLCWICEDKEAAAAEIRESNLAYIAALGIYDMNRMATYPNESLAYIVMQHKREAAALRVAS